MDLLSIKRSQIRDKIRLKRVVNSIFRDPCLNHNEAYIAGAVIVATVADSSCDPPLCMVNISLNVSLNDDPQMLIY